MIIVGFAKHSHFAVGPCKADQLIITPFYRGENRGSHLLVVAQPVNSGARTRFLVFFSLPHGLWENTKFLMNWLNRFPVGKLREGGDLGCVWEAGRGRPHRDGQRDGAVWKAGRGQKHLRPHGDGAAGHVVRWQLNPMHEFITHHGGF